MKTEDREAKDLTKMPQGAGGTSGIRTQSSGCHLGDPLLFPRPPASSSGCTGTPSHFLPGPDPVAPHRSSSRGVCAGARPKEQLRGLARLWACGEQQHLGERTETEGGSTRLRAGGEGHQGPGGGAEGREKAEVPERPVLLLGGPRGEEGRC